MGKLVTKRTFHVAKYQGNVQLPNQNGKWKITISLVLFRVRTRTNQRKYLMSPKDSLGLVLSYEYLSN